MAAIVDDFLAALSLGADKKSARLEKLVGRRLYEAEAKCRQFQHTALQWCVSGFHGDQRFQLPLDVPEQNFYLS